MLAHALRSAAQLVFAFNQSRAKVLFDPIYSLAAGVLLGERTPLSPTLASQDFPADLFEGYRARARKLQYYVEDWDFDEARPELLTARERAFVHTTTLGETSGLAVSDGFLRAFRTSPELASFFGTWFVEELNHFRGFHSYTSRMGERWPLERVQGVAEVEFRPYSDDVHEIAACNMFQELVAYGVYRSFGKQVRDPFLSRMVKQFAKDELRHFRFYQDVVARHIQREPRFRSTVLKVFLKATTPYNQVSGGARAAIDHVLGGMYYFRKAEFEYLLDQVEYLLGDRLEPVFDAYFRLFAIDCDRCSAPVFRCDCTEYEPHPVADEASDAAPLA